MLASALISLMFSLPLKRHFIDLNIKSLAVFYQGAEYCSHLVETECNQANQGLPCLPYFSHLDNLSSYLTIIGNCRNLSFDF